MIEQQTWSLEDKAVEMRLRIQHELPRCGTCQHFRYKPIQWCTHRQSHPQTNLLHGNSGAFYCAKYQDKAPDG